MLGKAYRYYKNITFALELLTNDFTKKMFEQLISDFRVVLESPTKLVKLFSPALLAPFGPVQSILVRLEPRLDVRLHAAYGLQV